MKQTLLLMVLALGMISINVSAQTKKRTPAKRITSAKTSATTTTKTREVGDDGFIWYKLKCGNLYGVQDLDGNIIIPIKFDKIRYIDLHTRYFEVKSGDYEGVYTRKGQLIVSTDRHFTKISAGVGGTEAGKVFWKAHRNGGGCLILDAKGNEAFSAEQYSDITLSSSFGKPNGINRFYLSGNSHHNMDLCYFSIRKKDSRYPQYGIEGICSLDGELIFEPRTFTAYMDDNGTKIRYYDNVGDDKVISINYDGRTRFDYDTFDELINYSYDPHSWASRHSSNTSTSSNNTSSSNTSSSSSNNNNSGGGTTTIVVEHQYTPQPVQEWQACFGCGGMGTMGCDNCGGSGTKYIGDRLHRCSRCNGQGIIPCNICYGSKGKYVTVYR